MLWRSCIALRPELLFGYRVAMVHCVRAVSSTESFPFLVVRIQKRSMMFEILSFKVVQDFVFMSIPMTQIILIVAEASSLRRLFLLVFLIKRIFIFLNSYDCFPAHLFKCFLRHRIHLYCLLLFLLLELCYISIEA